jgi:hypothetical protein
VACRAESRNSAGSVGAVAFCSDRFASSTTLQNETTSLAGMQVAGSARDCAWLWPTVTSSSTADGSSRRIVQ